MRPRTGRARSDGAGEPSGKSDRKDRILAAALELFAAKGHSGTTLREIARRADVDPALIHYFFGDKDTLFRDAVSSRIDLSTLFDGPTADEAEAGPANWGRRLARTLLTVWEDESTRPALVAVYRTGTSDGPIATTLRERVDAALASCLDRLAPDGSQRSPMSACVVRAHLNGLVMLRYVFPVEPLASVDFVKLTELLALAVEAPGSGNEGAPGHRERGTTYSCH
ncbi:TetR family transcriptional regulator [Actinacidiphila glaucinigra]|uniref:TetR/AcrR family transcriptional regulator n=1 Tax=Actinacidiphila glaucinigra TaxID=235986 RepID=UPI003250E083